MPSQAQGVGRCPPPPLGAPQSDSHRLASGQNRRGVPPPALLHRTGQGLRRMRHETLAARVSGRGAEGYGTNGLDAPSPAHPSSDPEGAGPGGAQPKGRAHSSPPLQTSEATTPSLLALPSMGPGDAWRWGLGSRSWGRRGGEGAPQAAADGYRTDSNCPSGPQNPQTARCRPPHRPFGPPS